MVTLKLKLALVTGAAGVVGEAVTRAFIEDGLRVAMVDLDQDRLNTLATEIGDDAIAE